MSIIDRTVDPTAVVDQHTGEPLLKRLTSLQSVWILGVLLVIVVFFSIAAGGKFLSASNFSLISQNIAVWAVLGVGMTFVIITAGIDLSIGSVLVFSSVVAAKVMAAMGGDGWDVAAVGIVTALVTGVAWGLLNGFLVAKAKIPALIVTLGSLSVALGLAQVITGGVDIRSAPKRSPTSTPTSRSLASRRSRSSRSSPSSSAGSSCIGRSSVATPTPSAPTSSAHAESASTSTGT